MGKKRKQTVREKEDKTRKLSLIFRVKAGAGIEPGKPGPPILYLSAVSVLDDFF
jgi:hypothetical protein